MQKYMDDENLIPKEQKGCYRGSKGCKDQLLISKAILQECKRRGKNLSMALIDYQKAFDRAPHSWIIKSLELIRIINKVISSTKKVMTYWKTRMEPLVKEPSQEELEKAICKLKINKAPGEDDIEAELIKNANQELRKRFLALICNIWREEKMPDDWKVGLIVPLFKKGDKMKCENYRGITLLNVAYLLTYLLHGAESFLRS